MDFDQLAIGSENTETKNNDPDSDSDEFTFKKSFSKTYSLCAEKALTLTKNNYIVHMSCTSETTPKICAALTDNTCELYNIAENQLNKFGNLNSHKDSIINVKFSSDVNLLYTGSKDCIKLWDLRTLEQVSEFREKATLSPENRKPLTEFDVSPNNRLLCAGTELFHGDAFLLFWDIRNVNLLGGYWDTHNDTITKLTFHPDDNNKIASGSTDGLINIYDLTQVSESDALVNSLNTESSVENMLWYTDNNVDNICCITHTADVQLWDSEEALRKMSFNRNDIAKGIQRNSAEYIYVANAHICKPNNIFLIAGSNIDHTYLRTLNIGNKKLTPNFRLTKNKQIIRTSWYNPETELLITGGERGILSVWQAGLYHKEDKAPLKSTVSKGKLHKKGPY